MSKPENVTTRPLTLADQRLVPAALELLNRTQGRGLFDDDYLGRRFRHPESFVVGAFRDEELVGVGVVEVITDLSYYLPFVPEIAEELRHKKVASFGTLAVLESLQGQGIGGRLTRARLEWAGEHRCEVLLGVSWISGLAHTSKRTFEKAGFRAVNERKDFYHASSLEKPFDCPGCRQLPCICGAILYRKDL
jgi:GNAT superfamily N-acetyltransferase